MIENKIKDLIIARYGSLSFFCKKINVPYSTIDSILKRGIGKANVLNVIKICNELGISVDSLKNGVIENVEKEELSKKQLVFEIKYLVDKTPDLTEQQKQHLMHTLDFICSEEK